ncbi:pectinesterase family protein [Phytohabitans suffuscus]|nr:pectinesterase family protein [Phytohabitans suffuscus]
MTGQPSWSTVFRRTRLALAALAGLPLAATVALGGAAAACPGHTVVVARDGSGDYTTVQAAVDAVPAGNTKRHTIRIRPGTYRELVTVPATKPLVSFVGTTGDNVRFLGNQDTLQPSSPNAATVSRAYYRDCYIEGDVDFVFGRGTAVFDRCEIRSLDRGSTTDNGYVTAASTTITNPYGYLFTHCRLTAAPASRRGASTLDARGTRAAPWTR